MKSAKHIGIFYFIFFLGSASFAQTHSITGKIIDSKTLEPIPFANVFLNNSTIGAATEVTGEFVLKNIQQIGSYELVVSSVGYDPYKTKINLADTELKVGVIRLVPNLIELNTVEVKGTKDVEWERKLKKFTKIFLGEDPMAEQCVITNPWVINFQEDNAKNKLLAAAPSPIQVENKALGYKLNFYLTRFVADNVSYFIQGNALFEIMKNEDPEKQNTWKLNRENSYRGSSQHLFKSIIDKNIHGEGFNLYSAALGFEDLKTRSTNFRQDLGKVIISTDTTNLVSPGGQPDVYKISFKGKVEAHYTNEKVRNNVYQDIRFPVSWITLKKDFVLVNKSGIPLNPTDVVVSGAMSEERIAYMLPIDYVPTKQERSNANASTESGANPLYEKIYIHTDKPYYYPGETIWLKGYLNYSDYSKRDTLSRTVYLELINGVDKSIFQSKMLRIDSGSFHSDFILPDTLRPAPYFIRSYTNWMRNYGDENLYTLYTPILNLSKKPEFLPYQSNEESILKISADKSEYGLREKINLTLETKEADGNPIIGNLSISVTDAEQVVDVRTSPDILKAFPIQEIPKAISQPNYSIERGLGFSAQLIADNKKIDKTRLDVIQTNSRSFYTAETDAKGYFALSNLNFYDSSSFLIRINKNKSQKIRAIKQINLQPRNIPPVSFNTNFQAITLQSTQSPQRETSTFEMAANTRMLNEVMVKGSKTEAVTKRPYGKADYILTAKDFNSSYGNLLQALPGKVPGLVVRQDPNSGWVVYIQRAASSSMFNAKEVAVLVNDVFMGGSPADILGNIAPATVETIEVKNTVAVLYGGQGSGGIISIYTKKGAEDGMVHPDQSTIKVPGYNRPRIFPMVDYATSKNESIDYRSLIYWNPSVNTNARTGIANVSFYAADLARQYRVKVEGVTEKGEPFHKEFMISVKKEIDF